MKQEGSRNREVVWSAGAKAIFWAMPLLTQRSIARVVKLLSKDPFPSELNSQLKKVDNPNEPTMHYINIGAEHVLFLDVLASQVVIMGIVEREGMKMLKRSMVRV